MERNAWGNIQIMPPTGGLTGTRNSDLLTDVNLWARRYGRGLVLERGGSARQVLVQHQDQPQE
jgi:Uma2 family endonuclease